jgi:NnrU protein
MAYSLSTLLFLGRVWAGIARGICMFSGSVLLLVCILALFGVIHVLPATPNLKAQAVARLGKAYGPVYGIASLVLFVAAIWSFRQISPVALYAEPSWGRQANFGLSLLGFLCLGIFIFRGSWRNTLRHPMAIGILLWAAGHLLANGDVATTVLFGGFAVIALLHALLRQSNGLAVDGPVREGHNLLSILAGVALYGVAVQLHPVFAGVSVIQLH